PTPPQTSWGAYFTFPQSTDTNRGDLVRFGSLVGSLDQGVTWFFIGWDATIGANTAIPVPEGGTLYLAVYSANYQPESAGLETGSFTAFVAQVPALSPATNCSYAPNVTCTVVPFGTGSGTPTQPSITSVTGLSSSQTVRITATGYVNLD